MWHNLPDYVNPFYKDGEHGVLQPSTSPQHLRCVYLPIFPVPPDFKLIFIEQSKSRVNFYFHKQEQDLT